MIVRVYMKKGVKPYRGWPDWNRRVEMICFITACKHDPKANLNWYLNSNNHISFVLFLHHDPLHSDTIDFVISFVIFTPRFAYFWSKERQTQSSFEANQTFV